MNNFTLLTDEQIFGTGLSKNNQLDIMKKYGTLCAVTDFAILLGVNTSLYSHVIGHKAKKERSGWWWTKSSHDNRYACIVDTGGSRNWFDVNSRRGGVRPVLPYSLIQRSSLNKVKDANGVTKIEFGEYPQTIVDENYSLELEEAYDNSSCYICLCSVQVL